MSVPKGERKQSRFEAQHHYYKLRGEVTRLMLLDFGFSEEKYLKQIERYREQHAHDENVELITERYKKKCDSFQKWFIDKECDAILEMLRNIETEFTLGNSIYPSETIARFLEFLERRKHINNAIGYCYALKQELQYVIRTLPVDINKYNRFAEEIDKQIVLYKGVRRADNRLIKPRKEDSGIFEEIKKVFNSATVVLYKITKLDK